MIAFMSPKLRLLSVVALLFLFAPLHSKAREEWRNLVAGSAWTSGETYAFGYATYEIACEQGRSCGVGSGISIAGKPLGEKKTFTGIDKQLVIGVGVLMFRAADGRGEVRIQFRKSDSANIPVVW